MIIEGKYFDCTSMDIAQALSQSTPYMKRIVDTPDNVMVQCPFHKGGQERKPSAGIRKSDGLFHCFSCGAIYRLPQVVSHCLGYEDNIRQGMDWLISHFASREVEERNDIVLNFRRNGNSISLYDSDNRTVKANSRFVTEDELDKYRYFHPYMWKRKLTEEIVELFDIGYDKETKCLTFPIRDINGNTLFVARRSVVTKYFNYPKGVEKPLYGLYEYMKVRKKVLDNIEWCREIIICESMLDALTAWVYGKPAMALNGLGNNLQFEQIDELPCRKIILATDNDDAGMKARKRIKANVHKKIITQYILPKGRKDLNELSADEFCNLKEVF